METTIVPPRHGPTCPTGLGGERASRLVGVDDAYDSLLQAFPRALLPRTRLSTIAAGPSSRAAPSHLARLPARSQGSSHPGLYLKTVRYRALSRPEMVEEDRQGRPDMRLRRVGTFGQNGVHFSSIGVCANQNYLRVFQEYSHSLLQFVQGGGVNLGRVLTKNKKNRK